MLYKIITFLLIFSLTAIAEQAKIPDLIKQLGADHYKERKAAEKLLWELVPDSIQALEAAAKSPDPEVSIRARRILDKVSKGI